MTVAIKPLTHVNSDELRRVICGYVANEKYIVSWQEGDHRTQFTLDLAPLAEPYVHQYDHLDDGTLARYQEVVAFGYSFGALDRQMLVGVTLAEPHWWNHSLVVWEFHVAQTVQRQGIGQRLMATLTAKAVTAGLRVIVCETQNTNTPAIAFYRKMGFRIEGIDISYYSNHDFPAGEVAIFMKKRL